MGEETGKLKLRASKMIPFITMCAYRDLPTSLPSQCLVFQPSIHGLYLACIPMPGIPAIYTWLAPSTRPHTWLIPSTCPHAWGIPGLHRTRDCDTEHGQ